MKDLNKATDLLGEAAVRASNAAEKLAASLDKTKDAQAALALSPKKIKKMNQLITKLWRLSAIYKQKYVSYELLSDDKKNSRMDSYMKKGERLLLIERRKVIFSLEKEASSCNEKVEKHINHLVYKAITA